jgi:hypothetical protein
MSFFSWQITRALCVHADALENQPPNRAVQQQQQQAAVGPSKPMQTPSARGECPAWVPRAGGCT